MVSLTTLVADVALWTLMPESLLFRERRQASSPSSNANEPRGRFRSSCDWNAASAASVSHMIGESGGALGRRPRRRPANHRTIGGSSNSDDLGAPWLFVEKIDC